MPTTTRNSNNTISSPNQPNNSKRKASQQDISSCKIELKKKTGFVTQLENMLRSVIQKPEIYNNPKLAPLRQFCEYRDNHRTEFQGLVEQTTLLQPTNAGEVVLELTKNYVQALANYADSEEMEQLNLRLPIVQVVSAETKFRGTPFTKTYNKTQQAVKMTHLRIMDGDNNTMLGRKQ